MNSDISAIFCQNMYFLNIFLTVQIALRKNHFFERTYFRPGGPISAGVVRFPLGWTYFRWGGPISAGEGGATARFGAKIMENQSPKPLEIKNWKSSKSQQMYKNRLIFIGNARKS